MRNLNMRCFAVCWAGFVVGCATPIEIPLNQDGAVGINSTNATNATNSTNSTSVDLSSASDSGADAMLPPPGDASPADAILVEDVLGDSADGDIPDGDTDGVVPDGTADTVAPDTSPDSVGDVSGNDPDA